MKKLLFVLSVMLMTSVAAMAQPDPKEFVAMQMERYQPEMKMTAEQTPKFEAALLASFEKMMKVFQDSNGDMEAMRTGMEKVNTETTNKIKEIVSPEQFKKYEEVRAKMMAEMQQY